MVFALKSSDASVTHQAADFLDVRAIQGYNPQIVIGTVARHARGPLGLELHRNGAVLIDNLPQPSHDAQFVVHLSLS